MNNAETRSSLTHPSFDRRSWDRVYPGHLLTPPPITADIRRAAGDWLLNRSFLFPSEIIEQREGAIEKAIGLMKGGYGLIVVFNHWSKRDPVEIFKSLEKLSEYFLHVPWHAPVGRHQENLSLHIASAIWDVDLSLITTPSTIREMRRRGHKDWMPRREEIEKERKEYFDTAAQILGAPGILSLSPWGTRHPKATQFKNEPLKKLVYEARERGVTNVAFLPIGIGSKDRTTYEISGYNPREKYILTVGECLAVEKIDPMNIDVTLHKKLLEVVPEGCRPQAPQESDAATASE